MSTVSHYHFESLSSIKRVLGAWKGRYQLISGHSIVINCQNILIQRPIRMQRFVVLKERNQIQYLNQKKTQKIAFAHMNLTVLAFLKLAWEQITFSLVCQTVLHPVRATFGAMMKFNSVESGFWHGQHFVLFQPYLQSRHIWLIEIDFDIPNDPLYSWLPAIW